MADSEINNGQDGALELIANVTVRAVNKWARSDHGDYEGALEILIAILGSDDFDKAFSNIGKAGDYYRTRLRDID